MAEAFFVNCVLALHVSMCVDFLHNLYGLHKALFMEHTFKNTSLMLGQFLYTVNGDIYSRWFFHHGLNTSHFFIHKAPALSILPDSNSTDSTCQPVSVRIILRTHQPNLLTNIKRSIKHSDSISKSFKLKNKNKTYQPTT